MKTTIVLSLVGLIAAPAWAADLVDEVKTAVQQLGDKPNYSWTTKTDPPPGQGGRGGAGGGGGGGRRNGQQTDQAADQQGGRQRGGRGGFGGGFGGGSPPAGKTEKGGFTVLTFRTGETTTEAIVKGEKVAVKEEDEWKTSAELAEADGGGGGGQGGFNRARFLARRAQQFKSPVTDAQELLGRVKELKKDGDAYSGEMTADAIKQIFTFRGRGGQQGGGGGGGGGGGNFPPPDTSGLKGTAKFWVKDGVLSKYETHLQGKMAFGRDNREFDMNRTTTVEINDIGSTKVDVPAEAKKKLKT